MRFRGMDTCENVQLEGDAVLTLRYKLHSDCTDRASSLVRGFCVSQQFRPQVMRRETEF